MKNCPSESEEQQVFVQWCHLNKIIVHHSPNEGGRGRAAMIRGSQMKRLGTAKGFWDLAIFVPQKDGKTKLIMIEMKRAKGGSVSEEQKEWGKVYESAGIPCKICKGADEAIEFVKSFLV